MKVTLTLILTGYLVIAQCQLSFNHFHGPGAMAIGNSFSHITGPQSIYGNPANQCSVTGWAATLTAYNPYEVPGLTCFMAGMLYGDSKFGHFGACVFQMGLSNTYKDQKLHLSYARKIFKKIELGIAFNLLHSQIDGYRNIDKLTLELGMSYHILPAIKIAVHLFNPGIQEYVQDKTLPVIMTFGIHYKASKQIEFIAEFEKNFFFPVSIKCGVNYKPFNNLSLSTGFFTTSGFPNVTGGIKYLPGKKMGVELAISYNQYLGLSSAIGIDYYLAKNK